MGSPAQQPDNAFTQMIARVGEVNRGGRVEGPVTAGPQPSVRSAAYGVVPDVPISIEERMELDAKLIELGITPSSEEEEGFPSRAEAEAIGAPIERPRALDAENVLINPPITVSKGYDLDPKFFATPGRVIPVNGPSFPKLPDFSQPGVLDLIRGVIYLDGLEFLMPAADLAEFRAYVVTTVAADIQSRLNAALAQFVPKEATDGADAGNEDVQPVQENPEPGSVLEGHEPA